MSRPKLNFCEIDIEDYLNFEQKGQRRGFIIYQYDAISARSVTTY